MLVESQLYERLQCRWLRFWHDGDLRPPLGGDAHYRYLAWLYSDPRRGYHNLGHIEHCLVQFDLNGGDATHPIEVELALWLHDAIYDAHADDNEERSAELAVEVARCRGLDAAAQQRVHLHILATKHDSKPVDADSQLVVDIDLSALALAEDQFRRDEQNFRYEYNWVPQAEYDENRRKSLLRFLERPTIYFTSRFRDLYEAAARQNLSQSLVRLG